MVLNIRDKNAKCDKVRLGYIHLSVSTVGSVGKLFECAQGRKRAACLAKNSHDKKRVSMPAFPVFCPLVLSHGLLNRYEIS